MNKKIIKKFKKINFFKKNRFWKNFLGGTVLGVLVLIGLIIFTYESKFANKVYPGVLVNNIDFSGNSKESIITYFLRKNVPFSQVTFTFTDSTHSATLSGITLDLGYDATLSATQAISYGRSGNFLSNIYQKYQALVFGINLPALFKWKTAELDNLLSNLSQSIDIPPQNALFEFKDSRVIAFKAARVGQKIDKDKIKLQFNQILANLPQKHSPEFTIPINIISWEPEIKTQDANNFGIKELIGQGFSYFNGSIAGRIHNVALAASRINGLLITPNTVFSFNDAVGDISAATGYKQAYVIKSGRTVLDDGGGVCQVSTTFFRAALNSGLGVVERHAHSYRVGYYEQGGWKPGFDATVYAPSYDLKINNNTDNYILIQSEIDSQTNKLTFSLYGQKDNREINISQVKLYDAKPAPPDLFQDDPTLQNGEIKQVDWAAPGLKASFDYLVTKNGETLSKDTFFSNYIPWQAVFLKGIKT